MACGGTPGTMMKEVLKGKHLRTIRSEGIKVPVTLDKTNFFCANNEFVLNAPQINLKSDLTHPAVLTRDKQNCADYDQSYFNAIYESSKQGGTDVFIDVSEYLELVKNKDGSLSCERVLTEFVDFVDAACLYDDHRIVLEQRPLAECEAK